MNGEREIIVRKKNLLVTSFKNQFLSNPWLHPIFDKCTLNPIYITNSPEKFTTITPTITENFNSKFTISNKMGHPVYVLIKIFLNL